MHSTGICCGYNALEICEVLKLNRWTGIKDNPARVWNAGCRIRGGVPALLCTFYINLLNSSFPFI